MRGFNKSFKRRNRLIRILGQVVEKRVFGKQNGPLHQAKARMMTTNFTALNPGSDLEDRARVS